MNPFKSTLMGAAAAALVLTTTTALAGSGVGGVFNLGQVNTVDGSTLLSGNAGGNPQLRVVASGTGAGVRSESSTGIGVNGISFSGTGQSGQSQSGIGLFGVHAATTGTSAGVEGDTASSAANARGVFGRLNSDAAAAGSAGVYGLSPAVNGVGVLGKNTAGGPGLSAVVSAGAPPLAVNSNAKVQNLNADLLDGLDAVGFWKAGGNAGTTPGTDFIGTSDNQALELKVNGQRALRIEPGPITPNLIGGYAGNSVDPGIGGAVIGGGGLSGLENKVSEFFGTVGGGANNEASGGTATVAGGESNTASGDDSVIGGGGFNEASGGSATVAGGSVNHATSYYATVAGGVQNTASGIGSAVPGGYLNTAAGLESFAAGTQAKATQDGAFVWGDNTFADVTSPAANTFTVRASGGIWLGTTSSPVITAGHFIDTSTGAYLSSAGVWTDASDRALKHHFRSLNTKDVLEKVARMPITSWSYKAEKPSVRHIGPMAQDFYKAFGLGLDDKHISTIDEGGVALAAVQGLYRENEALERDNKALKRDNDALKRKTASLSARLTSLEQTVVALRSGSKTANQASEGRSKQ